MRELTTLQRKHYPEAEAERRLVTALRGREGAITAADATALTGLPLAEVEPALRHLLGNYESHLAVTDSGELIYKFDPAMVRRDAVPLRERLAAAGQVMWRAFMWFFKVWIAVTLVTYVVAFVAMLVALVFARSASDRDDRRDDRDGGGFGFPMILFWMMPDWAPAQSYRQQRSRFEQPARPRKRFYRSVFDFVFGPPSPAREPLAAEREIVAYVRAKDGRITTSDLVALTGWGYDRADAEATRLLADYDGDPEVTDDGTIVYVFPSLRKTTGKTPDASWRYAWQEKTSLAPLTDNSDGTNLLIGGFNAFNLVAGLTIGPAFLARFHLATPTATLLVSGFPLVFSLIFFAVPAVRWLRRKGAQRRALRRQVRLELLGDLFERRGVAVLPDELVARAEKRVGPAVVGQGRGELEKLLRDLEGDVATDGDGRMTYAFPRLAEELGAADKARLAAPTEERATGSIEFTSEDREVPESDPKYLN